MKFLKNLDVEVLLAHSLNISKEQLFAHPETAVSEEQKTAYYSALKRISNGEPVAYITNSKEFYGLDFFINEHTLIPRPETEMIVDAAREILVNNPDMRVVEVGTGCGCISIALLKQIPEGF